MNEVPAVPAGHPERPEGEDGVRLLARMNGGHHEKLALWGLSHLQIAPDARMLDIGCGGGANLSRLLDCAPRGTVCGLDYSPLSVAASIEFNREAVEAGCCDVQEGDSASLPFPDASFDVVTAFETVYYWDLEAAFAEVRRVLVTGGVFLVCNEDSGRDPVKVAFAEQVPGMTMHTADALVSALRAAGFSDVSADELAEGDVAIVAYAR